MFQTYERSWRNDKLIIDNKQFDHILKIKLTITELDSYLMCTFTPGYSTYQLQDYMGNPIAGCFYSE